MNDIIYNKKILKKLFPQSTNKNIYKQLLIDKESKMYISTNIISNKISYIILNKLNEINIKNSNLIITDATAGVGGNTLSFSKYFSKVNSSYYSPQPDIFFSQSEKYYKKLYNHQ